MLQGCEMWATVPAADMARAAEFYEATLGLTPSVATDHWRTYRSGSTMFLVYPSASAGTAQHTVATWVVADVEAAVADLRRRGVAFEEYDLPGLATVDGIARLGDVERAAWFRDSEGNLLAVSQFLRDPIGDG